VVPPALRAIALLLLLLAVPPGVGGPPTPTYTNPVYARDFPDPFFLAHGGRFYAYATESRVTGFQVMQSDDLVHWTHKGVALEVPWSRVHYWAPEVVRYRGRFYMTYSAENPTNKKHDIGIAIAASPLGPFRHLTKLVEAEPGQRGVIDATIFFDPDGTPYLIYSEENPRSIVMRALSRDLLRVAPRKVTLLRPDRPWERGVTEAPTLLFRDGVYHLLYSAGPYEGSKAGCRYLVAHAKSHRLQGPYVKTEKPLLETRDGQVYGPGHQCLITLPSGETWMGYHAWDDQSEPRYGSNPLGRTLRIDRLRWERDTPRVIGPTVTAQPAPVIRPARW
jgi:beta-xylosidase